MKKLKVGLIVLVVLTVVMAVTTVYATTKKEPLKPFCFLYLDAHELSKEPRTYIPEDETLGPYVVEAVQNLGTWVEADVCLYNPNTGHWTYADNVTCTFPDLSRKYYTANVVYEGKFYVVWEAWAEPSFEFLGITPKLRTRGMLLTGWTLLAFFWGLGGTIALRNKKKHTAVP